LINDATPLRLESIADDPRSVGFLPNRPPMRGFLGVPILLRGRAYGNLYLTQKADGSFTAEDQELVETLASQRQWRSRTRDSTKTRPTRGRSLKR